jgi:glycosyltransferase involved in cell wall biosynthesis
VAIGVPLYDHAEHVREAIDSLLAQTYRDVRFVLVDDASSDDTPRVAADTIAGDSRATLHVNPIRLGMVANWRRAYELARDAHPNIEYFAWGSDHDRWRPEWLATLVTALDSHPEAVLAYPRDERIDDTGTVFRGPQGDFSTEGTTSAAKRVVRSVTGMRAGSMVYGLFRAGAIERAGVFRSVLHPDRLLLLELTMLGEFVQVPETLWQRRYEPASGTRRRQRRTLFTGSPPATAYLPSWVVHTSLVLRHQAVGESGAKRRRALVAVAVLGAVLPAQEIRMRAKPVRRAGRIAVRRARGLLGRLRAA